MKFTISGLFRPKSNIIEITLLLVKLLKANISESTIRRELEEHPNYASLLSISDVLSNYGIKNICVNFLPEKFIKVPAPFITQIKEKNSAIEFFTIVKQLDQDTITFFEPEIHRWKTISIDEFLKICTRLVLLTEIGKYAGEKEFALKTRIEKRNYFFLSLTFLWLPIIIIIYCVFAIIKYNLIALFPVFYAIITIIGAFISVLLILYELDEFNPLFKQLCKAGKKVNCSAILQAKASKIAGLSWSTLGVSYFTGNLILLLFMGITSPKVLFASAWFNVLSIPFVFFSVYYQWRIAKQWCLLCLAIQIILLLQFGIAFRAGWHSLLTIISILPLIFIQEISAFAIPLILISILLPALNKEKERKQIYTELQRLKHDPQIFEILLSKQKRLLQDSEGLGILLGNSKASCKIIKICNPYCAPCAKAHVTIEELLCNNPEIQLQIIFSVTKQEDDYRNEPVKHLLAIDELNDQGVKIRALEDWYLAEKKDYEAFAKKYPMNCDLKHQMSKIEDMNKWCEQVEISFTPTFFLSMSLSNGEMTPFRQLPEIYNAAHLKYFLSV